MSLDSHLKQIKAEQTHVPEVSNLNARRLLKEARSLERELRREEFFRFFIVNKMMERFEDDLVSTGFPKNALDDILLGAKNLSYDDVYAALSYPHELRERFLGRILERLSAREFSAQSVLAEMLAIAKKHGFSIGFHMSRFDIRENAKGWAVIGKEPDHRDDDLPMVYYSRSFKNLYRRKLTNYMYIVRAESNHRVGADGKWWRASSLSIVQKISVDELRSGLSNLNK